MLSLNPEHRRLRKQLDVLASSGVYDLPDLQKMHANVVSSQSRDLTYYLASLYLQLGEESSAYTLLSGSKRASRSMKKFCRVLLYCLNNGLSAPSLSTTERDCLSYLDRVVNPVDKTIAQVVSVFEGMVICGNAPSDAVVSYPDTWCSVYFNDYKKNPGISDAATIHVVTPSWKGEMDFSDYCCITGNDIFFRRSQVWKKFINDKSYKGIFTVPREIWAELYNKVGTSPSAGLLVLSYTVHLVLQKKLPVGFPISVKGFSREQAAVNHTYDSVAASTRHNWDAERLEVDRLLSELEINGCLLS